MRFSLATTTLLLATLTISWNASDAFQGATSSTQRRSSTLVHRQTIAAPLAASTLESDTAQTQPADDEENKSKKATGWGKQARSTGVASAAAMAAAAVNAAVSMRSLEAPSSSKTYISMDKTAQEIDEEGLPLVYDKDLIEAYWSKERGALNKRWGYFVGKAVPFLTKLTTLFIRDGKIQEKEIPALSRQARMDLQDLGPTFIKAGQMMSVRPDVLPPSTLKELQKLQDSVEVFPTEMAVAQIERELGGPLGQFFTSISELPVAAASLAQVYKATLNDGMNTTVAIKVQRPNMLGTVSKDLYVLRRAAEVFQGLIDRFAPQQKTNYVALLAEWSIGFYTELDFVNEAANQRQLRKILIDKEVAGVMVPKVYDDLCTRHILVSEWVDGKKLSDCTPEQIGAVTPFAQEAFLTQLFDSGVFHADPHPGNLLLRDEPTEEGHVLALIDCGLVAKIDKNDREKMISAIIHLANKDYAALVDDFINLEILPEDSNRAAIVPLMDKALSPYVKGGGAKNYEAELKKLYGMEDGGSMQSQVGGFQAMTQDALTVLNDVPFSIPPYFAILGRAIVTLEGVALTGNSEYGIIMESYPFIARKMLREERPEIQKALQEVLYTGGSGDGKGLKLTRLLALLNNAAGSISTQDGAAFVDLDAVPTDGLNFKDGLKFLLSNKAKSLRNLLEKEVDTVVDVLSRQIFRKSVFEVLAALTPPRPPSLPFVGDIFPRTPALDEIPLPLLLPGLGPNGENRPSVGFSTLKKFIDIAAPKLDQDEEIFAISLGEGAREFLGEDIGNLVKGEGVLRPESIQTVLSALRSGALGRNNALSSESAQSVIQFVSNSLSAVRRGTPNKSSSSFEQDLSEAIANLTESEQAQLDAITTELTQRSIQRTVQRLSAIDRLL